ncbi:DUF1877 family protein [Nonomuraea sp. NPDC049695]|uniref:DUF1877 family protein n=1 Tax=Nonomuraea sp. NPDC049695 TaxID=3154734 RepID=UPI0034399071
MARSRYTREATVGVCIYIDVVKDGKKLGSYDLDESAHYLRVGLEALGLDGDEIVHGVGGPDGVDAEGSEEGFLGRLTPEQVRAFWERLSPVTVEQFMTGLRTTENVNGDDEEYFTLYFADLKETYSAAVRADAGMTMSWY